MVYKLLRSKVVSRLDFSPSTGYVPRDLRRWTTNLRPGPCTQSRRMLYSLPPLDPPHSHLVGTWAVHWPIAHTVPERIRGQAMYGRSSSWRGRTSRSCPLVPSRAKLTSAPCDTSRCTLRCFRHWPRICTRCKLMYKCTDCLLIIDNNNLKLFEETITRFKSIITECKKCNRKIQDAICKICLLSTCLTGCP